MTSGAPSSPWPKAAIFSPIALKALVNHSLNGDVTSGYVIVTPERLREPAQRVTDRLRRCAMQRNAKGQFIKRQPEPVFIEHPPVINHPPREVASPSPVPVPSSEVGRTMALRAHANLHGPGMEAMVACSQALSPSCAAGSGSCFRFPLTMTFFTSILSSAFLAAVGGDAGDVAEDGSQAKTTERSTPHRDTRSRTRRDCPRPDPGVWRSQYSSRPRRWQCRLLGHP